jgi:ABC-type Fe3+-hydroxamate transport system substrate-binding protein
MSLTSWVKQYENELIGKYLSRNPNPEVISYLEKNPDMIDWPYLSENPAAVETLKKNNIPLIVLDSWDDFDETTLDYDLSIKMFDDKTFQQIINFTLLYFDQRIINKE